MRVKQVYWYCFIKRHAVYQILRGRGQHAGPLYSALPCHVSAGISESHSKGPTNVGKNKHPGSERNAAGSLARQSTLITAFWQAQIWVRMVVLRAERTSHACMAWHGLGSEFRAFWSLSASRRSDGTSQKSSARALLSCSLTVMTPFCAQQHSPIGSGFVVAHMEMIHHAYTYTCFALAFFDSYEATHTVNLSANASRSSRPGRRIIMVRVLLVETPPLLRLSLLSHSRTVSSGCNYNSSTYTRSHAAYPGTPKSRQAKRGKRSKEHGRQD